MIPKRLAFKTMGIWILFVVVATMAWQVTPALAGFTPTPEPTLTATATVTPVPPTATATATLIPPTATATSTATATATRVTRTPTATNTTIATATGFTPTATATGFLPTATATRVTASATATTVGQPTQTPVENTPEMPVTGGQLSDPNDGLAMLVGMIALLVIAIGLILRQMAGAKTGI